MWSSTAILLALLYTLPPSPPAAPCHAVESPFNDADFELTPATPGEMRLEVKTQLAGWIIPIVIRVR